MADLPEPTTTFKSASEQYHLFAGR